MAQRKSGFSLIELLVVIGIIAILAAILFPMLLKAQERSKMMSCLSNLKQLGNAVIAYRSDNNGYMPNPGWWTQVHCPEMAGCPDWCGSNGTGVAIYLEQGSIWPYTKNKKIYSCDTDKTKPHGYAKTNGIWPLSYSMLYALHRVNPDNNAQIKKNSRCLLFIHEAAATVNDGDFLPSAQDIPSAVHYDGTTVVYVDGHAVWKTAIALRQEYADGYWNTGHQL
ncbi:MAG: prepilin-type N-terminal cleavage/methylation domain-containing protein [Armatimonadetes bacterium]|nr:prepilin-type N-terminal cleavage/methylation domain-containing protein [Armatimonadota bacterium]